MDPLIAKYAQLCQLLGDKTYKKQQIEAEIEQIEKELYGVNFSAAVQAESKRIEESKKQNDQLEDVLRGFPKQSHEQR